MSNINNNESNNNEFFQQYMKQRFENQKYKKPIQNVILNFLKKTNINYAIIGGKAAIYHINKLNPDTSSNNYLYASSTDNYNILVKSDNYNQFINSLTENLRSKSR